MDHLEAIRVSAVEKYLLNELSPETRDEFEEHYFDCQECSTDLHATTVFMEAARQEFKAHPAQAASSSIPHIPAVMKDPFPQPYPRKKSLLYVLFQKPAMIATALAASLLVIVYQNAVTYPHLESQLTELRAPEILPAISLAGSNSRGGTMPGLTVNAGHAYLLAVDIPTDDRFLSYNCELQTSSGEMLWHVPVTSEAAKDLLTIHAPPLNGNSGRYMLVVRGIAQTTPGGNPDAGTELTRNAFDVTVQH